MTITHYRHTRRICTALDKTSTKAAGLFFTLGLLFLACSAFAGELRIEPGILASEEYNSNVYLTYNDKTSAYDTRIAPSLNLLYKDWLSDWDIKYLYDYRYYPHLPKNKDATHLLHLTNQIRVIEKLLFLDMTDDYRRVSKDVTRDYAEESNFVNQTDKNLFRLNPHIRHRLTGQTTIDAGYTYTNTWYKETDAIDTTDHTYSLEVYNDLSPKLVLNTGIRKTWNKNQVRNYVKEEVFAKTNVEYREGSSSSLTIGYSHMEFESGVEARPLFWGILNTYRYSALTAFLNWGSQVVPDPQLLLRREERYLAGISKDNDTASIGITVSRIEYRNVETNEKQTLSHTLTGKITYNTDQKTRIFCTETLLKNRDAVTGTDTRRSVTGIRIQHSPQQTLMYALEYSYTGVRSEQTTASYENNRVSVEINKKF